jgi:transposase-like protein
MANNTAKFPESLQAAIVYFADYQNCHKLLIDLRWPDGRVICPRCGSDKVTYLENARVWKCYAKHDSPKFSLKVGTIFEDSPISLDKWLMAFWLIVNCKNGISSCEMARDLKVTQKTAWFMDHRIREAIQQGTFEKIGGEGETVEVDETYIGGLAKNMHADKRAKKYRGGGSAKTAVFGLLARHTEKGKSTVRAHVVPDQWKKTVNAIIKSSVIPGTSIYSDEHGSYAHLNDNGFQHAFVKHAEYYVDGAVHTNGIENFWSLFKRGIKGTYISIEPFHTFRYIDEQAFRFNTREGNDADRFLSALSGVVGKRLTYKALTGKQEGASPAVN